MGLSIHWKTQALESDSLVEVTEKLNRWREACLDLPFAAVSEIQHFVGRELEWRLDDRSAPDRDLVLYGCSQFPIDAHDEESAHVSVDPVEVVGFIASVGDGCEWMTCLLARYPATATVPEHRRLNNCGAPIVFHRLPKGHWSRADSAPERRVMSRRLHERIRRNVDKTARRLSVRFGSC